MPPKLFFILLFRKRGENCRDIVHDEKEKKKDMYIWDNYRDVSFCDKEECSQRMQCGWESASMGVKEQGRAKCSL